MKTKTQNAQALGNRERAPSKKDCKLDLPGSINPWSQRGVIPWARRRLPFLKDEFQHLADQFWNFAEDELFAGDLKPAADIAEKQDEIIITLDVPGFDPNSIDVRLSENTITIRGEREACDCDAAEEIFLHRAERRCGKFTRTFAIPGNLTGEATARCNNGVLTIKLPKENGSDAKRVRVSC